MHRITKDVRDYYTKYDEDSRLVRDPAHEIEFILTMHFLRKCLPKQGTILDAGGGTGRYAIALARLGYRVVLLDLVPKHIAQAKKAIEKAGLRSRITAIIGDITDLGRFKRGEFDAVICLGSALSHVTTPLKIRKAMREFARVSKHGAKVCVSVSGRIGSARHILRYRPDEIKGYASILKTGYNPPGRTNFTHAHFFLGAELEALFESSGLAVVERVGLEGISSSLREETNAIARDKVLWSRWLSILKATANDPTAYSHSLHFMVIGKKR